METGEIEEFVLRYLLSVSSVLVIGLRLHGWLPVDCPQ